MSGHSVFPTRVGMVRLRVVRRVWATRFPHARGDGPLGRQRLPPTMRFSPRAWGWSASPQTRPRRGLVFPTRVGMVRNCAPSPRSRGGFPHARGDGPTIPLHRAQIILFSPRAWGWSAARLDRCGDVAVFPTRVGMVRRPTGCPASRPRFPHARGDGPSASRTGPRWWPFSPRAWGWSGDIDALVIGVEVFPTRVGMVRLPPQGDVVP